MSSVLFDFQPDDGPLQTLEVLAGTDLRNRAETLRREISGPAPALTIRCRVWGDEGQPRPMLFQAARISNVRVSR